MNLTVSQVVSQTVISAAWAAGSTITAKFAGERPLTGLMFGTAYSLITLPINLATQCSFPDPSPSSVDWAKRYLLTIPRMAIATFIAAKTVNLLGHPLEPGMAYRIQGTSIGLWSTVSLIVLVSFFFFMYNSSPELRDNARQRVSSFWIESRLGTEDVLTLGYASALPIHAAIHAIAAKCLGKRASTGAWLGAVWSLTHMNIITIPLILARSCNTDIAWWQNTIDRIAGISLLIFYAPLVVYLIYRRNG